jgi:hypothetical protein
MMFLLHFHYEDILRQDLLLKLNYANVMEVPGFSEIKIVPPSSINDFRILCGKEGALISKQESPCPFDPIHSWGPKKTLDM